MASDQGDLDGALTLTQYVFVGNPPRNTPRPVDTDGLSLLRGGLTLDEAARYVRIKVRTPWAGDSVRFTTVSRLRDAGFTVTSTPSRRIPIHASVAHSAEWDEDASTAFDACFADTDTSEGGD